MCALIFAAWMTMKTTFVSYVLYEVISLSIICSFSVFFCLGKCDCNLKIFENSCSTYSYWVIQLHGFHRKKSCEWSWTRILVIHSPDEVIDLFAANFVQRNSVWAWWKVVLWMNADDRISQYVYHNEKLQVFVKQQLSHITIFPFILFSWLCCQTRKWPNVLAWFSCVHT